MRSAMASGPRGPQNTARRIRPGAADPPRRPGTRPPGPLLPFAYVAGFPPTHRPLKTLVPTIGCVGSSTDFPRGGVRALLLLDNYDSFTMNLAHVLAQLGADVVVVRHDATTVEAALAAKPAGV